MRAELPVERLRRRLGADPETDSRAEPTDESEDATDDDQNSLLPRWLPDASERRGWVAKMRADPGRAGVIALAIVAALAVLVTVFTLVRDRPRAGDVGQSPAGWRRRPRSVPDRRRAPAPASWPAPTDPWRSAW
jgi:competence protein ComEA